jgi:hypothetical protein
MSSHREQTFTELLQENDPLCEDDQSSPRSDEHLQFSHTLTKEFLPYLNSFQDTSSVGLSLGIL